MHAVEPEHLGEALLLGLLAGPDAGRVVAAAFGKARAAAHRADVAALNHYLHRVYSGGIVAAGGGADYAEQVVLARVHAQLRVRRNDEWAQIKARALLGRDPALLHGNDGLERLKEEVLRQLRYAHALGGVVHALYVLHRAEELHGAVSRAVGLQALEDLLGVVQDVGAGHELDGTVGDYARIVPALSFIVVHHKHVVGKNLAETQFIRGRFLLRRCRPSDFYFLHGSSPFIFICPRSVTTHRLSH